tara:strand:+ start:21372 stop:21596 length:225 start_codon:yes stop_codon:yes gene_type:complete
MAFSKTKLLASVSECFDFTKGKVSQNLVQYIRDNNIQIDDGQLQGLVGIAEQSVTQSFVLSAGNIEKILAQLDD